MSDEPEQVLLVFRERARGRAQLVRQETVAKFGLFADRGWQPVELGQRTDPLERKRLDFLVSTWNPNADNGAGAFHRSNSFVVPLIDGTGDAVPTVRLHGFVRPLTEVLAAVEVLGGAGVDRISVEGLRAACETYRA